MKKYVVIVAGGRGTRMGTSVPKQFLLLAGRPVLMHTIELFYSHPSMDEPPVVVLPSDQMSYWKKLCDKYRFSLPHHLVEGGATRFQSVKNGLEKIPPDCIVGIHDGVRPLVSQEVIKETYQQALEYGTAIPVVFPQETIRKFDKATKKSFSVNRDDYVIVQTPQVFKSNLIKEAYQTKAFKEFTDDASVLEYTGQNINLTEGNRENIKITTSFDLKLAEIYQKQKTG